MTEPEKLKQENATRWTQAKRTFWDFWVAGTVGAFLTTLARCLPLHFQERSWPPDWSYTFDLILRYGYMLWFFWYFVISNINNKRQGDPKPGDIPFDILQSFAALFALFALDFTVPGSGFKHSSFAYALAFANGAVFLISLASLYWFYKIPPTETNRLRIAGSFVSFVSMFVVLAQFGEFINLGLYALSLAILWALLLKYTCMRLKKQPSEPMTA